MSFTILVYGLVSFGPTIGLDQSHRKFIISTDYIYCNEKTVIDN